MVYCLGRYRESARLDATMKHGATRHHLLLAVSVAFRMA